MQTRFRPSGACFTSRFPGRSLTSGFCYAIGLDCPDGACPAPRATTQPVEPPFGKSLLSPFPKPVSGIRYLIPISNPGFHICVHLRPSVVKTFWNGGAYAICILLGIGHVAFVRAKKRRDIATKRDKSRHFLPYNRVSVPNPCLSVSIRG